MGRTIQFESHHAELRAVLEMEHELDVLEFWDQPEPIRISYQIPNGRKCTYDATPDFFVLRKDSAGWMECKTEDDLLTLSDEKPFLYSLDEEGVWRCLPGEQYAAQYGLTYTVYASSRDGAHLARNLNFLSDYYRKPCAAPKESLRNEVMSVVALKQGISYPELLKTVTKLTADDLNYLIAHFAVYVDLQNALLVDPEGVPIYSDSTAAEAATAMAKSQAPVIDVQVCPVEIKPTARIRLGEKAYTIVEAEHALIQLLDEDGKISHLKRSELEVHIRRGNVQSLATPSCQAQAIEQTLRTASPADQKVAVSHWQQLQPFLGHHHAKSIPRKGRSLRRWKKKFRNALEIYGNGFIGLFPKRRPGNQRPRLHEKVETIIEELLKAEYERTAAPSLVKVHGDVILECEKQGFNVPSFKTFSLRARMRPQHEQRKKRFGKRFAYQKRKFYWYLDQQTPVHGDRPWEIAHIDHTVVDIELVDSQTGENLGRPWLTLMIDAHTRVILALVVSFFGESAESCMRVLRACVKRHGRLPQTLVVDQGKGFESVYFDTVCARYDVAKKTRPAAHARHGSVCERIFGSLNTLFIHNLMGNTKIMKNVRQVTKAMDPKNSAVWTFAEFEAMLTQFCFEAYNQRIHPALGMSPDDFMRRGGELYGARAHVYVAYDNQFRVLTMPSTKIGKAKVHSQKGIHINHLDYWNDEFADSTVEGKDVPVRFDPDDASVAHAFVKGQWRPCISSYATVFRHWSVRALTALAEEFRARHRMVNGKKTITARALADFMHKVGEMEAVMKIRRLERESRAEQAVEPALPKPSIDEQSVAIESAPEATIRQPINQPEVSECSVSYL